MPVPESVFSPVEAMLTQLKDSLGENGDIHLVPNSLPIHFVVGPGETLVAILERDTETQIAFLSENDEAVR